MWDARSLGYDNHGNLTNDGTNTYTWDSRNRLISANGAAFGYDGMGRRTSKSLSGTTINYMYDGRNVAQESSAGGVLSNILNGLGLDERFSRTDSAGRRSYIADALGSTVALADDAGAVQSTYTYEPYGLTTVTGASSSNSNQFTGRENDGSELYQYRARYYSAALGRFISEDPLGISGGLNLYEYALGNPIRFTDPLGEEPKAPPKRRYSRRSPTIPCVICEKQHGGLKGRYCLDCDKKSRDPKGQVPPNPYDDPYADDGRGSDSGSGDESDNANRTFDPFGSSQQAGFMFYFILFPCW